MTPAGITLLVIGIAVFIASFFIPDKGDREDKKDIAKKQEQIRKLMENELDSMKLRVNEATNETVEIGMEKSERELEKITNDKIMAVNEYATTVMEEIDRNHKEVMFLYDMLNDKQTDVKNTVRHAEAAVKEASDMAKTVSETAVNAVNVVNEAQNTANEIAQSVASEMAYNAAVAQVAPVVEQPIFTQMKEEQPVPQPIFVDTISPTESVFSMAANMDNFTMMEPEIIAPKKIEPEIIEPEREPSEFELLEKSTKFNNTSNNNQMILKMSAEGIPVVDIARQLSLGVGEVQLVIDLFK